MDARSIIDSIVSDPRVQGSRRFEGGYFATREYGEEPILKTGTEMVGAETAGRRTVSPTAPSAAFPRAGSPTSASGPTPAIRGSRPATRPVTRPSSYSQPHAAPCSQAHAVPYRQPRPEPPEEPLPERYRAVKEVPYRLGASRYSSWVRFREQAFLMADIEDDAPYHGPFERYYPTYSAMENSQLRGYVTWRTGVRHGVFGRAPLSFKFVYVYELLMGAGVDSAEDGFFKLLGLWREYRDDEPDLDRYLKLWLWDYAAYYGVDPATVGRDPALRADVDRDLRLLVVRDGASPGARELTLALSDLSSYRVRASKFYREHPDDLAEVVAAVWGSLGEHYRRRRKTGLFESMFGSPFSLPYEMFRSAVFVGERGGHPDAVYEVDPLRRYICKGGRWTYEGYAFPRDGVSELGAVLKGVDARMRALYGFEPRLKDPETPKYLAAIIDRHANALLERRREEESRRIRIDLSKLGAIRARAEETCESLLVDEEREGYEGAFEAVVAPSAAAPGPASAPVAADAPAESPVAASSPAAPPVPAAAGPYGLTHLEAEFLRRLLDGEGYDDLLDALGAPASLDMLVDGVNEKLFDLLGDTAVEFDGAAPRVVDDYRDDVRGAVL